MFYGTKLGASTGEVGWIGSAYGLTYLIMPAIIGKLGDKLPRKVSLIIAAVTQISIAFFYLFYASTVWDLILGQLLLGVANGFHWPALEAYISEESGISDKSHDRGMANFCIAWSIGYSIGPLLAGLFSASNFQDAFLLVLCLYFLNLMVVLFGVPAIVTKKPPEYAQVAIDPLQRVVEPERKVSRREIIALLIGMTIYAGLAKVILTYFANFAILPAGLKWSDTLVGSVLLFFGIGRTIYFLLGGFLKNSVKLVRVAFVMIGSLLASLIFLQDPWLIAIVIGVFGFFGGLVYLQILEILLRQEKKAKGAKAGLFESTIGLGGSLAPLFAGLMGEIYLVLPFGVFSGLTLGFCIGMYFFTRKPK